MTASAVLSRLVLRYAIVQAIVVEGKFVVEYRNHEGTLQSHYAPTLDECLTIAGRV